MSETIATDAVRIVSGRDQAGEPIFSFLVKRSYRYESGFCRRVEPPAPFLDTDVYWGDPAASSVRHESDLAPFKPATDVVVIGTAHAPGGKPVHDAQIGIEIGATRKLITVFGDRIAYLGGGDAPPVFSEPRPWEKLRVRYERAYGGIDTSTGMEFAYPRNPVGRGLVIRATPNTSVDLPNFEDPNDLLTPERLLLGDTNRWNRQPLPQGLGWFGKTWYPRMSFVGVTPGDVAANETMREEELGLVPRNHIALGRQFRLPSFDVRFGNGASLGLAVPFLSGDEPVRLLNLTPDGMTRFRLPGERPTIVADIGMGEATPPVVLHTVVIQPTHGAVDLVWRAALNYPGADWLPHMKRLFGRVA